ncbi:MAG: Jag N-terminal domain-containing protein, partial [Dehalococcoidia bacterium]
MAEIPEFTDEGGGLEATGKNVDEALGKALTQLGLRRDQVEVSVLTEGRAGILGVGAQPARVLVTPHARPVPVAPVQPFPEPDEPGENETDAPAALRT